MEILVNASHKLLDWLIPQSCLLCGAQSDQAMCSPCRQDLPWLHTQCKICALPLISDSICPDCQQKLPSFDRCVAAFEFKDPIGALINQFKHQRNYRNGRVTCEALVKSVENRLQTQDSPLPECLVPIPLHWRRLWQRGFNQSIFISQEIKRSTKLPIMPLLKRISATPKQQGLNRKARLKNLKNAFVITAKHTLPKHVAIIDDVMTTGATAEAASALLKNAGVQTVEVWVLARTPTPSIEAI